MRVAVFGLGYVGCTAAACIASQGHTVVGVDVSVDKVDTINAGRSPIVEPGIEELIAAAHAKSLLSATVEIGDTLDDMDIAIVCVGTPSGPDGSHDMGYIAQVTRAIAKSLKADRATPLTIAYRSTMRPGTTESIILPIFRSFFGDSTQAVVELVYNPEFLREAVAINDYFHPPKIVIGTIGGIPSRAMEDLHEGIEAPIFHVGIREAEVTKFVDNTWHAVKVAFANEIGRVCELADISARQVHEIFVSDTKLNISPYYLRPGGPFGGSCLPKDVRALQHLSADIGANTHLVDALMRSNDAHKHHQFLQVTQRVKPGDRLLLVGLAFKVGTDDLRESPQVDLARKLLAAGYRVDIYDSALSAQKLVGRNLGYAYANLPSIDTLLVDKHTAENTEYALVVATNALIRSLDLKDQAVVNLSVIR